MTVIFCVLLVFDEETEPLYTSDYVQLVVGAIQEVTLSRGTGGRECFLYQNGNLRSGDKTAENGASVKNGADSPVKQCLTARYIS